MRQYHPANHRRRSIRLRAYNYAGPGAYYVTICSHNHSCLFGRVVEGKVELSPYGHLVEQEWLRTPILRRAVELDRLVVMPNHLHGIIILRGDRPHNACVPQGYRLPQSLGSIIRGFKSAVTVQINRRRGTPGVPVWQRNYYEHIIRDEAELNRIREYIAGNPQRWSRDRENPNRLAPVEEDPWIGDPDA